MNANSIGLKFFDKSLIAYYCVKNKVEFGLGSDVYFSHLYRGYEIKSIFFCKLVLHHEVQGLATANDCQYAGLAQ